MKDVQAALKIAMLGHKRIPSREGGIEIVVEELAIRMVERGHRVTVYNRDGHHVAGKEYDTYHKSLKEYKGVSIFKVPTIKIKGIAAISSSFIAALYATFGKYDIIHFHAEGPSVMVLIAHLFKKRTIVTIHGLDWQRAKWGKSGVKYLKLGEKVAAKYADEVIVLSENVQQYFKDTYNRDTLFIPNGIVKPQLRATDMIAQNWALKEKGYILYLGRLVPEKGIHYLIEAYKQIETTYPLVIAGGSSDTDKYMNQLKQLASGDERIIFTGFVQGQMLEELYSNAYIYVLPSEMEGMPLSLLEAMSYSNCCLVSNIPECAEVIGRHGFLFECSNVDSLKEKLSFLVNEPDLVEACRKNAQEYILEKYDWEQVVNQTLRVYKNDKK